MLSPALAEYVVRTGDHQIFYLAAGPTDGPLIIFVHGWPELAISWRHQFPGFAALGFRTVGPDMRGYGRSTVYQRHEDLRPRTDSCRHDWPCGRFRCRKSSLGCP